MLQKDRNYKQINMLNSNRKDHLSYSLLASKVSMFFMHAGVHTEHSIQQR